MKKQTKILFAAAKGGVGKTTSALATCQYLAMRKQKVAAFDLDDTQFDFYDRARGIRNVRPVNLQYHEITESIEQAKEPYIVMDTRAKDGYAALPYADIVVLCIAAEDYHERNFRDSIDEIMAQDRDGLELRILITKLHSRWPESREARDEIRAALPQHVLGAAIPLHREIYRAGRNKTNVLISAPTSIPALAYSRAIEEITSCPQ